MLAVARSHCPFASSTCSRRSHGVRARIVSRGELYETVWGAPLRGQDRSVDVYVHKLRTKLTVALPEWAFIHTHFGFGYRFQPEPSQPFHKTGTGQ